MNIGYSSRKRRNDSSGNSEIIRSAITSPGARLFPYRFQRAGHLHRARGTRSKPPAEGVGPLYLVTGLRLVGLAGGISSQRGLCSRLKILWHLPCWVWDVPSICHLSFQFLLLEREYPILSFLFHHRVSEAPNLSDSQVYGWRGVLPQVYPQSYPYVT